MVRSWCHDEKAARELLAGRVAHGIDGLPGDQHGHDGGLASTRGQLEGHAEQVRVGHRGWRRPDAPKLLAGAPSLGATSVSQMAVSTASIWQKNGADAAEIGGGASAAAGAPFRG
jgi:hypothetical protein